MGIDAAATDRRAEGGSDGVLQDCHLGRDRVSTGLRAQGDVRGRCSA
jgi:hypothetical protein